MLLLVVALDSCGYLLYDTCMARYATNEDHWQCWGCGFDIPIRSMWTKEKFPQTYRCPQCEENILYINCDDGIERAGAYYGPLLYVDYTNQLFVDEGHVPVLNRG